LRPLHDANANADARMWDGTDDDQVPCAHPCCPPMLIILYFQQQTKAKMPVIKIEQDNDLLKWQTFTRAQLKDQCRARKMQVTGTRQQLLDRLHSHCGGSTHRE